MALMSSHVRVDEPSQVGEARRTAVAIAGELGWGDDEQSRVALAVTELATNLVKHARDGGDVVLSGFRPEERLDVLALDRGPGITNLADAMRDGFSTNGTVGAGLGAIERTADRFEVRSQPSGTVVLARFGAAEGRAPVGGACLAKPGEHVSGDGWSFHRNGSTTRVVVADGLGHGASAAEAAAGAIACFEAEPDLPLERLMERIHGALRATRGAAVALLELEDARIRFLSVGNVAGQVLGGAGRAFVCTPGTVGHAMRTVRAFDYELGATETVVLHTDGVRGNLDLADFPGLAGRDTAVVAGAVAAERARGTDDATVVAIRSARTA